MSSTRKKVMNTATGIGVVWSLVVFPALGLGPLVPFALAAVAVARISSGRNLTRLEKEERRKKEKTMNNLPVLHSSSPAFSPTPFLPTNFYVEPVSILGREEPRLAFDVLSSRVVSKVAIATRQAQALEFTSVAASLSNSVRVMVDRHPNPTRLDVFRYRRRSFLGIFGEEEEGVSFRIS